MIETAEYRKPGRPRAFDRGKALYKAMLTFWQSGYETTSISDLTAAMGISSPSLYSAFGDKKALFLEALSLSVGDQEELERSLSQASTAYEAVQAILLKSAIDCTEKDRPKGSLVASATASGSSDSSDVQAAAADIRRHLKRVAFIQPHILLP